MPVLIGWEHAEPRPTPALKRIVRDWLDGLWDHPRQRPSRVVPWPHPHSSAQLRLATVPRTSVDVLYAVDEGRKLFWFIDIGPHLNIPD